ncbi:hypothetical protein B0T16DRAFT_455441 [Cercophora newfieldiana]|uniref:Uncharacterized protein n=1 Tax=Cercophora newfieldiana TaxID=92897 RepID=A0AA39YIA5_9PEZI|nr:hypothetical protein B0T16DRAFT_455441 [Cercophora newfieldiana]
MALILVGVGLSSVNDPIVEAILDRLLLTIQYQPVSGDLFTAQTPLFSVVIGSIVAYKLKDRDLIRAWFEPICEGSRGNVPPAYEAIKQVWVWLDAEEEKHKDEVSGSYPELATAQHSDKSDSWWEELAAMLVAKFGRINLA